MLNLDGTPLVSISTILFPRTKIEQFEDARYLLVNTTRSLIALSQDFIKSFIFSKLFIIVILVLCSIKTL